MLTRKISSRLPASASLDELVVRVYDDVPPDRHGIAKCSLAAHLIHLQQQGLAEEAGGRWSLRS